MHAIDFEVSKLAGKTISEVTVDDGELDTVVTIKFTDGTGVLIEGLQLVKETETHRIEKNEIYIAEL